VGFDAGGIDHVSAEMLLKTIGRDTVSLGEKYEKKPYEGELWIKYVILSNEVPNLQDAGGVLQSRFIKLDFKETFWGREDASQPIADYRRGGGSSHLFAIPGSSA
jgi:putative DNA primase/helicase